MSSQWLLGQFCLQPHMGNDTQRQTMPLASYRHASLASPWFTAGAVASAPAPLPRLVRRGSGDMGMGGLHLFTATIPPAGEIPALGGLRPRTSGIGREQAAQPAAYDPRAYTGSQNGQSDIYTSNGSFINNLGVTSCIKSQSHRRRNLP